MATFRKVQVEYWQDEFTLQLTPEEKFFYIYLMTNTKSNQIGCYALPKKVIEFETGYNRETVEKLVRRFAEYGKIDYSDESSEILIKNWHKYNWTKSPKVFECIKGEYESVKDVEFKRFLYERMSEFGYSLDTVSKPYPYSMDTLSKDYGEEEEKEEEEEKDQEEEKEKEGASAPDEIVSEEVTVPEKKVDVRDPYTIVKDHWNALDKNIPKIEVIKHGTQRHNMLKARINEHGIDVVVRAIDSINQSDFLKGYATTFTITFDWFIRPNNFIKVLEGNYKNKEAHNNKGPHHNRTVIGSSEEEYYEMLKGWATS